MTIKEKLGEFSEKVNQQLESLLPASIEAQYSGIGAAMRYSLLGSGKRIRAFLTKTIAHMFGAEINNSIISACIIEILHCYSLIHDDLPALDNDDWRRGKASNHKVFGEAMATLAGDALLTLAFEVMASHDLTVKAEDKVILLHTLASNAGYRSLIYGQVLDNLTKKPINKEQIIKIHGYKTASMFQAACEIGGTIGKTKPSTEQWIAIREFATKFGLLYQLIDDWQDRNQKEETNLVSIIGTDKAQKMADNYLREILIALSKLPAENSDLQELARDIHHKIQQ